MKKKEEKTSRSQHKKKIRDLRLKTLEKKLKSNIAKRKKNNLNG